MLKKGLKFNFVSYQVRKGSGNLNINTMFMKVMQVLPAHGKINSNEKFSLHIFIIDRL